jgi:hypothetical protein
VDRDAVIQYLRDLPAKAFADVFYAATDGKHPWPGEENVSEVRHVLAYAHRDKDEPTAQWDVSVICPVPDPEWDDDAPVCQHGSHCGLATISWAKRSVCPVCGGEVYGS